jgi:hypothetical protein
MSNKTITVNPELFKIQPNGGGRGTRKKKMRLDDDAAPIIKVRAAPKEKTKRSILKFIRNQQH